jgi:hypothetical protein
LGGLIRTGIRNRLIICGGNYLGIIGATAISNTDINIREKVAFFMKNLLFE